MAYADGELEESQRAEIAAALEQDPELARRVQQHRALRAEVSGAFAAVLQQPMPERLTEAARNLRDAPAAAKSGNVVQFPARATRPPAPPWRAREWLAMAASLLLGVMLSWRFLAPAQSQDLVASNGSLVAGGRLETALNQQLASEPQDDSAVLIG